jgi:hypothetical protein
MSAATGQDLAAADGGHARAEAMAALAHDFARLIGALHGTFLNGEKERGFYGSGLGLSTPVAALRNKITGGKGRFFP